MRLHFRFLLLPLLIFTSCAKKGATSENASPDPVLAASLTRGELVYKQYCVACHMADGGGAPPMNPTLSRTSFVLGDKNLLIPVVLYGMSNREIDGKNYHNVMPPLDFLTDEQVADVLTYVRNNFGNAETGVSPEEVKATRKK